MSVREDQSGSFRVAQTYDELHQLIEDEALSVLADDGDVGAPRWYDEWSRTTAKRIADNVVCFLDAATEPREEWRFFWPHAKDDMNGARWRSERPSLEEIAEWRADLPVCWLERREVHDGDPQRVAFDDGEAA